MATKTVKYQIVIYMLLSAIIPIIVLRGVDEVYQLTMMVAWFMASWSLVWSVVPKTVGAVAQRSVGAVMLLGLWVSGVCVCVWKRVCLCVCSVRSVQGFIPSLL